MKVTVELDELLEAIKGDEGDVEGNVQHRVWKEACEYLAQRFGLDPDMAFSQLLNILEDKIRDAHRHLMDVPTEYQASQSFRYATQTLESLMRGK